MNLVNINDGDRERLAKFRRKQRNEKLELRRRHTQVICSVLFAKNE
jgi:hypothetical protein